LRGLNRDIYTFSKEDQRDYFTSCRDTGLNQQLHLWHDVDFYENESPPLKKTIM